MSNSAKWYRFEQNNSGGSYLGRDEEGLGQRVFVQANSPEHAVQRFEALNEYVCRLGFQDDRDCECCGGRWWGPEDVEQLNVPKWLGDNGCFAHPLGGPFYRVEGPEEEW
jgi:hypothetical protein